MRRTFLTKRRWIMTLALVALLLVVAPVALFVLNGVFLAAGERPRTSGRAPNAADDQRDSGNVVKILSWNIAKGFVHKNGLRFDEVGAVQARMQRIAAVINAERPDFVFLAEVVFECSPCPVNQLKVLAEATGMETWASGENYNFGLPFYRVVGGNAILSRRPLEAVANPALAGRQPFYVTKNNRRVLWCATEIGGQRTLLAAIHTDSYDPANNLTQTQQILEFAAERCALLAGDFNAEPGSPSIRLLRESGRFAGSFGGPTTFTGSNPEQRIDYVMAPAGWQLLDERVIECDVSDHRPVVATFRVVPGE